MQASYSFDSDAITSAELEAFRQRIWDPAYTDFSLKSPVDDSGEEEAIGFNPALFELLLEALTKRAVPIRVLSLEGLHVAQLHALLRALSHTKLISLDLSYNEIDEAALAVLRDFLKMEDCPLRTLVLQENDLGDKAVLILEDALKSPHCLLESLDLSRNDIGTDSGFAFARILQSPHAKLKSLLLPGNAILEEGLQALAHALGSSTCSLERLDLSDNYLAYNEFIALAEALISGDCSIKCFDISANEPLEGSALETLASALGSPHCPLIDLRVDCDTASRALLLAAMASNPTMIYFNEALTAYGQAIQGLVDKIEKSERLAIEDIQFFRTHFSRIHTLLSMEDDSFSLRVDPFQSLLALEGYLGFLSENIIDRSPALRPLATNPQEAYQIFFEGLSKRHQQIVSGLEEHLLFYLRKHCGMEVSVLPLNVLCSMPQVFSDGHRAQATLALCFQTNQSALANLLALAPLAPEDVRSLLMGLILRASDVEALAFEGAETLLNQTFSLIRLLLSTEQQETYRRTFESISPLSENPVDGTHLFNQALQYLDASTDVLCQAPPAPRSSLDPLKDHRIDPIHPKQGYDGVAQVLNEKLIPHQQALYASYVCTESSNRIDLLFLNNHHFDRLCFYGGMPSEPSNNPDLEGRLRVAEGRLCREVEVEGADPETGINLLPLANHKKHALGQLAKDEPSAKRQSITSSPKAIQEKNKP